MATVFVSFDWHNDRDYRHLLQAWHANPKFKFTFDDATSGEIDTSNVGRIKGALTTKVQMADYTLVIVGEYANARHRNAALIGYKNWINFEIARSVEAMSGIVVVRLKQHFQLPEELAGVTYTLVEGFTEAGIMRALDVAVPARRRAS